MTRHPYILFGSFLLILFFAAGAPPAHATTNISSNATAHWAWNDAIGWIDFYNTNSVTVSALGLAGYASSSAGDISLDCHTTSIGNICATSNYQVTNDGAGNLSGWGWNDQYGWISFDCHNNSGCGTSNYQVYIDASGIFNNYAWNDLIGWISFNCGNYGGCPPTYSVTTSWVAAPVTGVLDSATFDTGIASGAQLNSVLWHGSQPAGTSVYFQFATSNSSAGPWNFIGTDGTPSTYYATGPDVSLKLNYAFFNDKRYFRYRVVLQSNVSQTLAPRVDDVLVNWSP